ncbi:C-C motif chemokine 2-like isoform X7 [Tachysurus fulvidraco]|uniref:C-C motif chemokine 2-like isoform X7 n=1 Tax=Tachysurus fulvidraco TaxID=1234273 RepID=UPI001FEF0DF3|nr:C-C motif chemokine 2-like isoform X7 [Tachysurus fulvidraco]XP_047664844.1 C-C motif chemokine 2-like isoform X7 [Tachysurus fulvidraco]XP_047664845.1 C-C motif chemokine 2-like isoform X7 [Tachysurus fulvidraco]
MKGGTVCADPKKPCVVHRAYTKPSLNPCPCIKISSKIVPLLKTKSYYLQKSALCDITAAVLKTEKGRTVCADPNKPWVIKAMKFVEDKRRTVSTTASAMFTASEPTVITTETMQFVEDKRRTGSSTASAMSTASEPTVITTGDLEFMEHHWNGLLPTWKDAHIREPQQRDERATCGSGAAGCRPLT